MTSGKTPTRAEVEDFLFHEAALLDEWRLEEWLALLTEDATYEVPSPDSPDSDCRKTLALVFDDRERIEARVAHYVHGQVVPENPRSRVRRFIANVRILGSDGDVLRVTSNVAVHRFRNERQDVFVGRYDCDLVINDGGFRIRRRRFTLDLESLRAPGMLTIIL